MKDPRQATFTKIAGNITKKLTKAGEGPVTVNAKEKTMHAASVNLGELSDDVNKLIETKKITTRKGVHDFVAEHVERLKSVELTKQASENGDKQYRVNFVTKDDYGRYWYGFKTTFIRKAA